MIEELAAEVGQNLIQVLIHGLSFIFGCYLGSRVTVYAPKKPTPAQKIVTAADRKAAIAGSRLITPPSEPMPG